MSAIASALKFNLDVYVCADCASKAGGVWPKDHVATFHSDECAECKQTKALAALSDWSWPGREGEAMRQRREM